MFSCLKLLLLQENMNLKENKQIDWHKSSFTSMQVRMNQRNCSTKTPDYHLGWGVWAEHQGYIVQRPSLQFLHFVLPCYNAMPNRELKEILIENRVVLQFFVDFPCYSNTYKITLLLSQHFSVCFVLPCLALQFYIAMPNRLEQGTAGKSCDENKVILESLLDFRC